MIRLLARIYTRRRIIRPSDKTDYHDNSSGWMIRLLARIYTRRRIIRPSDKTDYHDNSSGWMIRLLARIYTQTDYQTSYRSLRKLVLDG